MASTAASPAGGKPGVAPAAASPLPPLIPISLIDGPAQRLWAVSAIGAVQAYKFFILFASEDSSASLSFALLIDLALLLALSRLRIPRLDFLDGKWVAIGALAGLVDWLLMGGWRTMLSLLGMGALSSWLAALFGDTFSSSISLSESRVRISDLVKPGSHILGQHTIHVLPYSTAAFSPSLSSCHCIGPGRPDIKIPVVFNNTEPHWLQYSVTPFDDPGTPAVFNVTIHKGGLTTIATEHRDELAEHADWDEVEAELVGSDALARREGSSSGPSPRSAKTKQGRKLAARMLASDNQQRMYQLPVKHTGRVRLERVLDRSRMDARISQGEIMIVGCPTTSFMQSDSLSGSQHKCPGDKAQLNVAVRGLAPLELTYRSEWTPSTSGAKPEIQSLSISHISNTRIASPLVGGEGSSTEDALSVALGRRRGSESQQRRRSDFGWAVSQEEVVPISLDIARPGSYAYELRTVKDACGNIVDIPSLPKHETPRPSSALKALTGGDTNLPAVYRKQVEVHSRAHATIVGCSTGKPLQLLRGGKPKELVLKATQMEPEVEWAASVRFQPEEGSPAAGWKKNVTFGKDGTARMAAAQPGLYLLEGMDGTYCTGEIGSPWSCPVIEVPPPTADISFSAIEDVCAGSVGVNAMAILTGQPPFRLSYEIKRSGQPARRQERVIERTREEFEFRPSTKGAVEYRFTGLADANYRDIHLNGPVFEQIVHPLASARFVHGSGSSSSTHPGRRTPSSSRDEKIIMRSCEGNRARADIALEGTGPFDVTYVVRSGSGKADTEQRTVTDIKGPSHTLDIDLPAHINTHGGTLTVSLVSIKDGKSCERPLTTADVVIEIRRGRPTAVFAIPGVSRGETRTGRTQILEGREARLPIRLEGEAPWKVEYLRDGDSMPVTTTIRQSESELIVDRPGLYNLVAVHDAFCEGTVPTEAGQWQVSVAKRPSVHFMEDSGVKSSKNGSLIRPPVCQGTPDSVFLELSGQSPMEVSYEHRSPSWSMSADQERERFLSSDGASRQNGGRERDTFTTAQNVTAFQLSTSRPGWHTYELLEVGDTVYPLTALKASKSQRLEQMVHSPPSAAFAPQESSSRKSKKTFCVGDSLHSQRDVAPTVQLNGQPPFTLEFELQSTSFRRQGGSRRFVRRGIRSHTYTLGLEVEEAEEFKFDTTGNWGFRILSLEDGNGCVTTDTSGVGNAALGGTAKSAAAHIEVADTASIAAVGTREDYCVGETVDYM
jgi:nucleoporin POM152